MPVTLKLRQHLPQRLAVEDQLATLPGHLRAGIGRHRQIMFTHLGFTACQHDVAIALHAEGGGIALHPRTGCFDHERT
ncbi:hypothetical protein D3C71_1673650 [compost metagenome]